MQVDEGQLRDFLIDSGLLTRGQLASVVGEGGENLYHSLLRRNVVAEDDLRRAAAHATGTTFIILTPEEISVNAMMLIPEPISRTHSLVAYALVDGVLEVALLDLDDLVHLESLKLPYRVRPRLTSRDSIKHALRHYQKVLREKFGAMLSSGAQVVDALIHHALLSSAHGVHINVTSTALIRYRIGSVLREAMQLPQHIGAQLAERLKTVAKLLPTSSSLQEGKFKFEKDGETHMVHVSALPIVGGEQLVLRLARESQGTAGFALTSLGLHGEALERTHALIRQQSGLVLVAGLQGAGKTTTLYTLLDQLTHKDLSIATIEEKIEHRFPHIAQTQIKPEVGITSVAGLRALLKQDPDVVMVGEITDSDTALLAAHAASTGVLVLAGIEASSAAVAIERLQNFGVAPLTLAATLRGVVGVETVKKLCPHEREEYLLSRAEGAPLEGRANFGRVLAALKEEGIVDGDKQWKEVLFARATPCSQCEGGYKGLVGLQEVLPISGVLKQMILGGATPEEIEGVAREEGMLTIIEDALYKAGAGLTSVEEVFRLVEGR